MNKSSENGQKHDFGPDFGPFSRNLGPQFFLVSFISTSSKTFSQAIML